VMDDTIRFYPPRMKNIYRHWMENVRDWCISRQLWWGHRIPAYYLPDGNFVVASNPEEALAMAKAKYSKKYTADDLQQDNDVLDTWFSSWLWPISVFDGIRHPENKDIQYYYPTNDMVTAPEILFFWVARMIMAGLEYRKEIPFRNVYLHGIVRDAQGRKMSKSLGNSPDPLGLIDKYGADGVRVGMLFSAPAGNDLLFDEGLCEQGRNFCNKIWNAFRLTQGWEIDPKLEQPQSSTIAAQWFESKLQRSLADLEDHFSKFRMADALMLVYKLIWDDFCSWYLEMVKPAYQQPIDTKSYVLTINFFEKLLKVLHPFMPFISEEIYQHIRTGESSESIMIDRFPEISGYDETLLNRFDFASQVIMSIRNMRQEKNIAQKDPLRLMVKKNNKDKADTLFDGLIMKLCNLDGIEYVSEKPEGAFNFIIKTTEFYIPVNESIDVEAETEKLQQEITYQKGFLNTVMKKLSNEKFVNNAPAKVVEMEKKKQTDAENKIKVLEDQIKSLKKD
ncbi:MAG: class I tRNA ligase family protein, partial [Bacteroidales bacterium]